MVKVRDVRFDTLKGILILCVLYRHFIQRDMSVDVVSISTANFVHLFTMPLFVFISGYFTRHVNDAKKYWNGILGIFETYVVFQLIKGILYHYSIYELIAFPAPMMWYMLALIYWKALYYVLCRFNVKVNGWIVLFFVILTLIAGFIPFMGRAFAISRFIYFAPWFFLGIMMQKVNIIDEVNQRLSRSLAWIIMAFALIVTVLAALFHFNELADIFRGGEPYPTSNQWLFVVCRLLSYGVSFFTSVAVIRLLAVPNKILETCGIDSLKFYMFQGLGLMAVGAMPVPWNFPLALVYATVVAVLIFFFNKTKLSDFAIRPINYVVNHIKSKKQDK